MQRSRAWPQPRRPDSGFTILELVVVIAILGILFSLIIPAVGQVRESGRRLQCKNNLRQFGIAVSAYESMHQMFPPGSARGASTQVILLPFLDQKPLYERYDWASKLPYSGALQIISTSLPMFVCPSESAPRIYSLRQPPEGMTSYSGNSGTGVLDDGYNGMFRHLVGSHPNYPEGPIRAQDVRDGLSNTALASEVLSFTLQFERLRINWNTPNNYTRGEFEKLIAECDSVPQNPRQYGWMGSVVGRGLPWTVGELGYSMYNHAMTPNRPSCYNGTDVQTGVYTAASLHSGGVNLVFADGHTTFIASAIDAGVWREMGSRVKSDVRF